MTLKHYALTTLASASLTLAADQPQATPHSFTANLGLFSEYRFRGIDQTFGSRPCRAASTTAISAASMLATGTPTSAAPGGRLEMDFYGGYKTRIGNVALDLGAIYYYYPGTYLDDAFKSVNARHPDRKANGVVDNGEIYLAGSWRFLTLKYHHALTDYFQIPGTRGTGYLDLAASHELGNGLTLTAHVGHLFMRDFSYRNAGGSRYDGRYTDWRLGLSKDFAGWVVAASYIATDAQGGCGNGEFYCFSSSTDSAGRANGSHDRDAGRTTLVFSVARNF
ncbi:TorF family putative porin [Azotobacter sp. CWF10]